MFGKRFELFKLAGFAVRVDLSWIVIAVLITWSLASGVFPQFFENLPTATYWAMGVAGALGLFASIILHELSHSLVARRFGMPMKGITLFIFGGVAEMDDEPPTAKAEFAMAIAGPIASVLIALACGIIYLATTQLGLPVYVSGVFGWLAWINAILVAFNILPAFPLDGGRVLRSALWHYKRNLRWATRITSQIGSGFGIMLIVLGAVTFIGGNFIGGMWWFLIGMFLRGAAQMSYQQVLLRRALEGEGLERFMRTDVVTVSFETPLSELVENYIYKHHFKMYPVLEDGHLRGCVTIKNVRNVPREQWHETSVADIAEECSPNNTVPVTADAMEALKKMNSTGASRLMVVDGDQLAGVIALKDVMRFISVKLELDEDEQPRRSLVERPAPDKEEWEKTPAAG